MRRISIGSWAYTIGPYAEHPVDFDTVTRKLKELGFDGVELGGFKPHPNPDDFPTKESRAKLKESLAAQGLGLSGLAANLWSEQLVNTDNPIHYVSEFEKNCDFCVDLGIRGIRVDTVQPPTIHRTVEYDRLMGRLVEAWQACCDIAARRDLYVTWEFEPGFAFNKCSDILRVHDAIDRPNFGLLYDTSHGQTCGVVGARQEGRREVFKTQREFLERLRGRINHIHLIDSDNTCHKDKDGNDETSLHLPFGNGIVDFDSLVPVLAQEKLSHDWWTIDLCFWPDAWEATAQCKTAIDALNRKYGN